MVCVLMRCIPNLSHHLGIGCGFVVDIIAFGMDLMECMESVGAVVGDNVQDNVQDDVQDSIAFDLCHMHYVVNACYFGELGVSFG